LDVTPTPADFTVTQSIDSGEGSNVTATDVTLDSTGKIATLTVPAVVATAADQSVVYSVSYKGGETAAAEAFTVNAEGLVVTSVTAINATTIDATFAEDASVVEADLTGKTITLTAGETTLIATYKASSLAGGKATYQLGGTDTLVDAATYTVSAEGMSFTNSGFVAKVATPYVKTIAFDTTKIAADTAANNNNLVFFTAKNQYGEDLDLTGANTASLAVTGTLNGVPFLASELADQTDLSLGKIEINKNLVEGNTVALTVKNTVNSEIITAGTANYTVGAAETAVETTVTNLVAKYNAAQNGHLSGSLATEVMPDDEITLTVDVKNQFGNKMTGASVRWVVEEGLSLIAADGDDLTSGASDLDETAEFKATGAGQIIISAYLANGEKVSYEVIVGKKALSSLTTTTENPATTYNNEDVIVVKVDPNAGAVLTPDMLKFSVTANTAGTSASDIALTASKRGGDTNPDDIIITAHSAKIGSYGVVAYIGDSVDAQGAIKAASFNVTTAVNPTVASIAVADFAANELTAGRTTTKAVTFKNAYGETVSVTNSNLNAASTSNMSVAEYKDENGASAGAGENVTHLGFTPTAAGTDTVTLVAGSVSKSITTTSVAASTLTSIELGSSAVTVIIDDTHDVATPATDDLVAITGGETYKLIPIALKDQYGNAINVNASAFDVQVTGTDAGTIPVVEFWTAMTDGTTNLADGAANPVKYLAIKADAGDTSQTLTIQMRNEANSANIGSPITLGVTVNAARALASLSVTPGSGSAVVGATRTFTLSGVDQYSGVVNLDEANVQLETLANVTIGGRAANTDGNKADFTLSASQAGSYNAKIFYSADATLDANEKFVSVPFTAAEIGDAIASVEIQPTVRVTPNGVAAYDASLNTYKAQITEGNVNNTYAPSVKAYDVNGNEVGISSGDVIYSVVSHDLKENGGAIAGTVSINATTGVLTVNSNGAADANEISGTVVVKAATLNGIDDTMTLTFDSSAAGAQTGTYYLADVASTDTALTSIVLDEDDTNGYQEVVLVALDQYGQEVDITESSTILGSDSSAYFTKATDADSVNLTAKATGTTNLRVFVGGNQEVMIPVTVAQGAVDLVAADIESVATDEAALALAALFNGGDDIDNVTQALDALPAAGANGTTITWASDDAGVVTNDAQTVNRPVFSAGDATVTLTATITKGAASDTKDFVLTVIALADQTDITAGAPAFATTDGVDVALATVTALTDQDGNDVLAAFVADDAGATYTLSLVQDAAPNTVITITKAGDSISVDDATEAAGQLGDYTLTITDGTNTWTVDVTVS